MLIKIINERIWKKDSRNCKQAGCMFEQVCAQQFPGFRGKRNSKEIDERWQDLKSNK